MTVDQLMDLEAYIDNFGGVQAQGVNPRGWLSWGQSPATLAQALLQALEDLIHLVPGQDDQDREATILAAVGAIYDKYVTPNIPTIYKPFSPLARYLVVQLVLPQVLTWLLTDNPLPQPVPTPGPAPTPTVIIVPQEPNDVQLNKENHNV